MKGELDLVGYDGNTLAFVEVRTCTVREEASALPELSIAREKRHVIVRTAKRFLAERHVGECPCRFDVMAIDNRPGAGAGGTIAQGRVQPASLRAKRETS
jgi:putative endonuclease